jgi:hypothetical protein
MQIHHRVNKILPEDHTLNQSKPVLSHIGLDTQHAWEKKNPQNKQVIHQFGDLGKKRREN